ncbi:MAG: S9 family peptidase [Prevotellaceae bacterium]|jgi:dipeptidyl-peptidase-4|nr:S9 family peptidase [Prevotellaceae bacterium]
MKLLCLKHWLVVLLITCVYPLNAQKQQLTDAQIVKFNSLGIVHQPIRVLYWLNDSQAVLGVPENRATDSQPKLMLVDAKKKTMAPYNGTAYAPNLTPRVITKDNILYLINAASDTTKVVDIKDEITNPTLSPNGQYVAFTRNNDLYTLRIADKKETRWTFDGSDVILNGYASWAYMEEILGRFTAYRAFWWSPDSKYIAFFHSDDSETPLFTITEANGQHGRIESLRYPKAGDNITKVWLQMLNLEAGKIIKAEEPLVNGKIHDDRYLGTPIWRSDSRGILMQWMNHGQDYLKLFDVNAETGKIEELYSEKQKAWISLDTDNRVHYLDSGKGFILQSDKSGWNHLYLHNTDGKLINPITSGEYTVKSILHIDEKNKTIYFTCQKDNITFNDLYRVGFDGEKLQCLTFGEYNHAVSLSSNGEYFITSYSNHTTPARVDLYTNTGKLILGLDNTKGKDFDSYILPKVELVKVKAKDGKFDLPMKVIYPLNMKEGEKYPVIVSTYGGPNAPRLRGGWALTNSQCWYAKEGVIQVTVDHRGSGHFGKIGTDYMHRNLGYWEMEDYIQCVQWLIDNAQADPDKVCITGFSYGGYISSYALGYAPEVFTHAMAGGSVTDWLLYDAPYTERFMDSPQENPEGYKSSSVFTHLPNMKGKLLIYHGEIDENVHVQNTIQLVSKMQDLGKDFEMMIFPSNRHGWRGTKRDFENKMRMEFIYKYFLEKPIPEILRTAESAVGGAGSY